MRTSGSGLLTTIRVASGGPLTGGCALSVAMIENEYEPLLVGVPDRAPPGSTVSPGGSVPSDRHVYGGEPPLAEKLNAAYGYVTIPAGGEGDAETTIGESLMRRLTGACALIAGVDESVTITANT